MRPIEQSTGPKNVFCCTDMCELIWMINMNHDYHDTNMCAPAIWTTCHFDRLFSVFPPNTENFSEEKQKKPFLPTFTCIQEIQEIERSPGLCLQMSLYRPHT